MATIIFDDGEGGSMKMILAFLTGVAATITSVIFKEKADEANRESDRLRKENKELQDALNMERRHNYGQQANP